jgi:hypothetical protein
VIAPERGPPGLVVELQDAAGKPLPNFTLADRDELFGDTLERTMTWEKADLSALADKPIPLRMVLSEADLYSLRFGK